MTVVDVASLFKHNEILSLVEEVQAVMVKVNANGVQVYMSFELSFTWEFVYNRDFIRKE